MFFYQVVTALVIFHLCMIALFGLKLSPVTAVLVIPLLPLTLLFTYFCSGVFTRPFQVLSLRAAVDLDEYRQVPPPHPCPRPTSAQHSMGFWLGV